MNSKIGPWCWLCFSCILLPGCETGWTRSAAGSRGRAAPQATHTSWSKIFTVEVQGATVVRKHRGYLGHETSAHHPEGHYEVLDVRRKKLGFVLGSKAYLYVQSATGNYTSEEIANQGVESGILKILGVGGKLELVKLAAGDIKGGDIKEGVKGKS